MFDEIKREAYSCYNIQNQALIKCMMDMKNWTFDIEQKMYILKGDLDLIAGMSDYNLKKLFEEQLNKKVKKIDTRIECGNCLVHTLHNQRADYVVYEPIKCDCKFIVYVNE